MIRRTVSALLAVLFALGFLPGIVRAQSVSPMDAAEHMRSSLVQAQLVVAREPQRAKELLAEAQASYQAQLAPQLARGVPDADAQVRDGLTAAGDAVQRADAAAIARSRAQVWTGLLAGAVQVVEQALEQGDIQTAQTWLTLREFRHATRFSRPNADATNALDAVAAGTMQPVDALLAVRADLLDTYQARLTESLHDYTAADAQSFPARRAEAAALAQGYFAILAPAYSEQRGADAQTAALQAFAYLQGAESPETRVAAMAAVEQMLQGFRAAPLSAKDQARRAGQMLRFLNLVPVEYSRGVVGRNVTRDLEIREAVTFRDGAAAAFNDLQTLMAQRNSAATDDAAKLLATLEQQLSGASNRSNVPTADEVQRTTDSLIAVLQQVMPPEWQQRDSSGDFDVISSMLDQMEAAVAAGQYDLAESARLEAYAVLESGPEAKLVVFAPQMKLPIEDLFWYGQGEQKGLAQLISSSAPAGEIKASRKALDAQLAAGQQAIAGQNAPVSVASNAAIIVFREGLEAVLILASLMGSFKTAEMRRYRVPMWVGAVIAFLFSVLTWAVSRTLLNALLRFGINAEMLEAIVSIIAIGVLLLITNWFFHQVYWTGWMASFHQQKKRLIGGEAGKWVGLIILGFTSIYREGFETVLFLQALVLESGAGVVLTGVAIGLAATAAIGFLVFVVQAKLPHKKMLIVTGVMIGVVLLQMVGNTVHVMQVVGWLPTHPIRWLASLLPYWSGLWFGLYATWEGIILQFAAGAFVIGSYFLAERQKHKKVDTPKQASSKPQQPATSKA